MATPAVRPNLLVLMTDQQRYDAMSAHGGWVRTPVLDRMAAEGCDLRGHYAQAPVCVPSRTSLFTGRYPHAHRVLENDARLASHEVHLFKALKQAGYHLTYAGKNHLLPAVEGPANFDAWTEAEDDLNGDPRRRAYLELEQASLARLEEVGSYASSEYHDFPDGVTTTGLIAARARADLAAAPLDQSWCATVSFRDPHVPHLAPRRFAEWYPPESLPLPEWREDELAAKHPRLAVKREVQNAAAATPEDQRHYLAVYGAMCSFVDEQIGTILEVLAQRADADRTLVLFTSDHGDFCWRHGLCKKDLVLYDDLLHVPAIVRWPGYIRVGRIDALTEHVDLVPTLLDFAGVRVPIGCQGRSLGPLLLGETDTHRTVVHAEVCHPGMRSGYATAAALREARAAGVVPGAPYNVPGDYTKALRTERWKYLWYGDGFEELYDVADDPGERCNRAKDPDCADVLADLRLRLMQWVVETADPRSPRTEREQLAEYTAWKVEAG